MKYLTRRQKIKLLNRYCRMHKYLFFLQNPGKKHNNIILKDQDNDAIACHQYNVYKSNWAIKHISTVAYPEVMKGK